MKETMRNEQTAIIHTKNYPVAESDLNYSKLITTGPVCRRKNFGSNLSGFAKSSKSFSCLSSGTSRPSETHGLRERRLSQHVTRFRIRIHSTHILNTEDYRVARGRRLPRTKKEETR